MITFYDSKSKMCEAINSFNIHLWEASHGSLVANKGHFCDTGKSSDSKSVPRWAFFEVLRSKTKQKQ